MTNENDILQRIRDTAALFDGDDSGEPFVDGTAFAEYLRNRFPEAFEKHQKRAIALDLLCQKCSKSHVDRGIWATRLHRTHLCEHCGHEWQPSTEYTVGLAIDDEKNAGRAEADNHRR